MMKKVFQRESRFVQWFLLAEYFCFHLSSFIYMDDKIIGWKQLDPLVKKLKSFDHKSLQKPWRKKQTNETFL